MKKIILFLSAVMLTMSINACSSSDDDGGTVGGKITATINGVSKTFDTVVVNKEMYTYEGKTITNIKVTATIGTALTTERFTIVVELGKSDNQSVFYVDDANNSYSNYFAPILVVTTNSAHRLKGTISGLLRNDSPAPGVEVTDGTFDIHY